MTAKTVRNKGRIDCTRGVSREQRAKNRSIKKLELSSIPSGSGGPKCLGRARKGRNYLLKLSMKRRAVAEAIANLRQDQYYWDAHYFGERLRNREENLNIAFEERSFGQLVKPREQTYRTSAGVDRDLSSIVVSLALFEGDKMLFACSGIPLPHGKEKLGLTRFVTSAHLVRAFKEYRNEDDKLRVAVRLPDNKTTDGFLGLYDEQIAIVTCLRFLAVHPVDLDFKATLDCSDDSLLAAGRGFESGSLMAMRGSLCREFVNTWVSDSQDIFKAVLGGPLLGKDASFLGMNFDIYEHSDAIVRYTFLPLESLCERLKHFQVLNHKQQHYRGYSLPNGVSSVVPSGFLKTIYRIRGAGYPMPPPLVLELNGKLLNRFEEDFGDCLGWKGYPYGNPNRGYCWEHVWNRLPKKVVSSISRRVVSLASFSGKVRYFACTGLFIKWNESKTIRSVILTSASLVRSRCNEDDIDNSLTINVFLPPNQRAIGKLELYNLNYNIAIISVENFKAIRPEDIFAKKVQKSTGEVVAIGRHIVYGHLMASRGEVKHRKKDCKLDCKDLKLSTCNIKKVGIGGPLINFYGNFIGMNFYDGSGVTPFLPRRKIVEVLSSAHYLPSERGHDHPMPIDVGGRTMTNRWPVPEPYWHHGALDVNRYDVPVLRGRVLQ